MPSNWRNRPRPSEKSLEKGRSYNRRNRESGRRRGGISGPASQGVGGADISTTEGAPGGNTEGREQSSRAFDSIHSGPGGTGSTEADPGTDLRGRVSTGVVWLPAEEVSARCDPTREASDSGRQDLRHRF